MGMPITVEIRNSAVPEEIFTRVFAYFTYIDNKFSTYKPDSEISLINQRKITTFSDDMELIFQLSEETRNLSHVYFDINNGKYLDPSGLVKGWAIKNAARIISSAGYSDYYIEAGGDIQVGGTWKIGIRDPFNFMIIIKVITVTNLGVATSGTYERGNHIYNPHGKLDTDIVSLTVIGPDIYEADRFATAAYAMGKTGITFISSLPGFSAYQIDKTGQALFTPGFEKYVVKN